MQATDYQKLSKMNSQDLLSRICKGDMNSLEANAAARILERRFPTPSETLAKKIGGMRKVVVMRSWN